MGVVWTDRKGSTTARRGASFLPLALPSLAVRRPLARRAGEGEGRRYLEALERTVKRVLDTGR